MAAENDIVLIYFEEDPLTFARIEQILPDSKPNWYHVKLLILQLPLQVVTWILRDVYINGEEFTMDGKKIRLEKVQTPESPEQTPAPDTESDAADTAAGASGKGKVISLRDLKKS